MTHLETGPGPCIFLPQHSIPMDHVNYLQSSNLERTKFPSVCCKCLQHRDLNKPCSKMSRRGSWLSPLHFPTAGGGPASEQNHPSQHSPSTTQTAGQPPSPARANTANYNYFQKHNLSWVMIRDGRAHYWWTYLEKKAHTCFCLLRAPMVPLPTLTFHWFQFQTRGRRIQECYTS